MPRQPLRWMGRVRGTRTSSHRLPRLPSLNRSTPYCKHQVDSRMLQCAAKEVDRSGRRINYTDLSPLATQNGFPRQLGKILERNVPEKKRKTRKLSKGIVSNEHDVFLGGSCNPTTWRQDEAIPLLESLNITYYNPQVGEWSSELVSVERNAKDTAKVLFYVLDKRTRNVVGIVEAANFASTRKNRLVLVMDSYRKGQSIASETISLSEYEDLSRGLVTLKHLLERQGIPVFQSISHAINSTAEILSIRQTSGLNDVPSLPNKLEHFQLRDKYFELREAFNALDTSKSGEISLNDCCMAYERLTNKILSIHELKGIIHSSNERDINIENGISIKFEDFCLLVDTLRLHARTTPRKLSTDCSSTHSGTRVPYDIYLTGSFSDISWQQKALPFLKASGVRFEFCCESQTGSSIAVEADIVENSKTVVFVISSTCRGLETMALASYYLGVKQNIVLCIQELKEGCYVKDEPLSKLAVNDYNRGRVYLSDEAKRRGVSVFGDIEEAVRAAVSHTTSS